MIEIERIQPLNEESAVKGEYVLYWMQASIRTRFNHALEYAIQTANEAKLPVLVCFGLMDDYPEANERHYFFMLQGLRDVEKNLRARGIQFVVKHGAPADVAVHYAKHAAMVVTDRGYLRHQKRWRDQVADEAGRRVVQVETDVVVPVDTASDHHEFAARTIRPKIHRQWEKFLVPLRSIAVKKKSANLKVTGIIDVTDVEKAIKKLKIDRTVQRSSRFVGGENAAADLMKVFIKKKLDGYSDRRNEPSAMGTSTMAGYLHFGQVSPIELGLMVRDSDAPTSDRDSYLEELIVRRELAMNFANFNPKYDSYDAVPEWARKTLGEHRNDKRPKVYTRAELEAAKTGDPYWNAAQLEMTRTGFMHNYMRMYWGKKVLEWKDSRDEAYADILYLNNKYFICGRDPNAYTNVAWIFGLHDRPWGPARPIFGTVRYMNSAGLDRKFDMDAYVKWVDTLL